MQVFITQRAERNLDSIVAYIKQRWGEKTAKEFIRKVDDIFTLLQNFPLMGPVEKDDIRGFQLSPQTRVLYRLKGTKIIVLAFFDVRQNPKKKLG